MVTAAATANAPGGWARATAAASGRARYSARCAHASAGAPAGSVPAGRAPGRQRHLDHAGRGDAGQVGGRRDQHRLPGPGGHVPVRGDQPQPGLRDEVRAKGGDLLDCPISGSPGMVAPRLATTFASGDKHSVEEVTTVLDAISGPWIYTGPFGTGARMKYVANLLLAVHTVAAAEAMALARRSGLDLQLVQKTLDESIASSAIWKQRGPLMAERAWTPAPGPVSTLHPILEQIEEHAASTGLSASVFAAAKEVFDRALADGWGDLDIACVHDQVNQ